MESRSSRADVSELGRLVRELRVAAGLSQEQLADRATLTDRTIRNIENGQVAAPRPASVRLLARALDLPAEEESRLLDAARGLRTVTVPVTLPPDAPDFVGREDMIRAMESVLAPRSNRPLPFSPIAAVFGMPGAGKPKPGS